MNTIEEKSTSQISRKDAIRKAGKYAVFTAAAAVVMLAPKSAQAWSGGPAGAGDGYRDAGYTPPGGGAKTSSPFTKPESSVSSSGSRNSPWK